MRTTEKQMSLKRDASDADSGAGMSSTLNVESTRFGTFQVDPSIVLSFPQGMIGFPQHRDYVLIKQREDSVFLWLHSLSDPSLAFPVVIPWAFYWDYEVKLSDDDLAAIEVSNASQISIMCVVNVGSDVRKGTINLFSPIVINNDTREAKQVINTADGYSTRDRLFRGTNDPTPVAMHEGETVNVAVLAA